MVYLNDALDPGLSKRCPGGGSGAQDAYQQYSPNKPPATMNIASPMGMSRTASRWRCVRYSASFSKLASTNVRKNVVVPFQQPLSPCWSTLKCQPMRMGVAVLHMPQVKPRKALFPPQGRDSRSLEAKCVISQRESGLFCVLFAA